MDDEQPNLWWDDAPVLAADFGEFLEKALDNVISGNGSLLYWSDQPPIWELP